tara:strand:- start:1305 stop:1463 length:159 start_codon:yes stop_codon:yes gene_type:complete
MFSIRAVLTNRDFDDARPTLVSKNSNSLFSIFSGKISTAVDAAEELFEKLFI